MKKVQDLGSEEKRADVQEVVKSYSEDQIFKLVEVLGVKKGKNRKYYCPIHDDGKISNLSFNKKTKKFKCFSAQCKFHGDILELVAKDLDISKSETVDWISDKLTIRPLLAAPKPDETVADQIRKFKEVSKFLRPQGIAVFEYLTKLAEKTETQSPFQPIKQISDNLIMGEDSVAYSIRKLEMIGVCDRIEPTAKEWSRTYPRHPAYRYKVLKEGLNQVLEEKEKLLSAKIVRVDRKYTKAIAKDLRDKKEMNKIIDNHKPYPVLTLKIIMKILGLWEDSCSNHNRKRNTGRNAGRNLLWTKWSASMEVYSVT